MIPKLNEFDEHELGGLDPRTSRILRLRTGLADGKKHTLAAIGKEFGIGKERVRNIQNMGLAKIGRARIAPDGRVPHR